MANLLAADDQLRVLHMLVEGNSLRSTTRLTGVHRTTIQNLLVRVGNQCRELLDQRMRGLQLRHVQVDEIWTFCGKKEGRVRVEEKSPYVGDQYLFVALDQTTKLVPTFALGKRSADLTRRFMVDLASRLDLPKPYMTDYGRTVEVPQISSDGWKCYPEAVDLAFGASVLYGQLIKDYRNTEMPGRYAAPEMIGANRKVIYGNVDPHSICTSHVERNNLTIRTFMKRFARLSLGFSKKLENLAAAVALHVAHYNFCRRHSSLRVTPAMAAGVTDRLWNLGDLLDAAAT